eukprot:15498-Eustigmatos_ZCMA.PRE.1
MLRMKELLRTRRPDASSSVCTLFKVLGIEDVVGFDYFEPPSVEQLHEGLLLLHALGALDDDGH